MAGARQHVAPPLQADFAGQRLADLLADARDLDIEGIQRQQRAALARTARTASPHSARNRGCAPGRRRRPRIACRRRALMAPRSGRRDAPALADHDVVGADRRSGLHRVQHDPDRAQRLRAAPADGSQTRVPVPMISVSMLVGRGEHPRQRRRSSISSARVDRPGPDRRPAGTAASRDATCRQSGSRPCRRRRSAPTCGRCGASDAAASSV